MFEKSNINEKILSILKKELKLNREAGTYIFYGFDRENLKRIAKMFAKGLNCKEIDDDFCNRCESCLRIEKETHGDLEILEDISGIKVDKIRELIEKNSVSSYEGNRKIYIIRDIEKLRKESGNALLKLIEEPTKDSFFILLTTSLNILPTIKSRGILIKIPNETAQELGVSDEEYKFFLGRSSDIHQYKTLTNYDLKSILSFETIGKSIKLYNETQEFKYKVDIYKALRDFINVRDYLTRIDRIFFAEEIFFNCVEKEMISEILNYSTSYLGLRSKNLEKLLNIKKMSKTNTNLKTLLTIYYLNVK